MKITQGLTKENFFNGMAAKYPNAHHEFGVWIDKYKDAVDWQEIMYGVKFHDLPYAVQLGIFLVFVSGFNDPEHVDEIFTNNSLDDGLNVMIELFFSIREQELTESFS